MPREIPDFSVQAIGRGCFFLNDGGRKEIRDDITGELRFERVFTSDRFVDEEDEGIVEFSERAAKHIASTLGWVHPKEHTEIERQLAESNTNVLALKVQIKELLMRNEALCLQMTHMLVVDTEDGPQEAPPVDQDIEVKA